MIVSCVDTTQLQQCEISLHQATSDAATSRRRYQEAVEETGRLEARIQAFSFSSQTEQTQLTSEVRRRDELIQTLRTQQFTLQDTIRSQQDQVHTIQCNQGSGA